MIASIFVGLIGILLLSFGYLIWKKEKISLLHDYHYDKVSDENKKVFCKISGQGICIIGIGLVLTAIVLGITDSQWCFIIFAIGFVIGLAFLIYAGNRYNRK